MDHCGLYLKYTIFALEFILFAVGCAAFGGAVWVLVSENIWIAMMENKLLNQGAIILIVATVVTVLVAVIAMWGTLVESKWTMIFCCLGSLIIFALMITVGIMGVISSQHYPQDLRDKMRQSLVEFYGVDLTSSYNSQITETWDHIQTEEECCGVEDESWGLFRNSRWFQRQTGVLHGDIPLVPETCCLRSQYDNYINRFKCQTWNSGPPSQQSNTHNDALIYRGCYHEVLRLLRSKAQFIMGIGFSIAIYLIPLTALIAGVSCRMP